MGKTMVDYREHLRTVIEAFSDQRVLLVSQGKEGKPNVMAIGWGSIGIIWRKPIFTVLVRPSRYTCNLIEESGEFTVNIAGQDMKDTVRFCGSVSGREVDKFKERNITPIPSAKIRTPMIKECFLNFECKVVHRNDMVAERLEESLRHFYEQGDYHRFYHGEIVACYSGL